MAKAPALSRQLGLWDLVLFNIAAVAGIRWLAAAAHAGPVSIPLWILAAAFFFIPSALAVSRLSELFPEQGGIYAWTKHSFGDWHGFLCGWCYWLSNLFYFPNLLLAGIGMAVFAFGTQYAHLADSTAFAVPSALVVLWTATITNLIGWKVGRWTENLGALATYGAGAGLIVLGFAAWATHGSATPLDVTTGWTWDKVNFWSQIAFAFGGLELGAVLGGEIRDPRRTIARAAWISGGSIAAFYILGTLAVMAVLPPDQVNVVSGLAQAGAAASARLGIPMLGPIVAIVITAGVTGQLGAWMSGSARVPFAIGLDRYLPEAFTRLHPRWGTPHVALLTQAAACTVFLIAMLAGENLRTGYQLLVDMTVITYFIPFLYLFASAIRNGRRASGAAGLVVTCAGIAFSLVPPAGTVSPWAFEGKLAAGCLLVIGTGRMAFVRARR